MLKLSLVGFTVALLSTSLSSAELINQTEETGVLFKHVAPEMGRLAVIDIIGDYVITIPEAPSSPAGSDWIIRAWDFSDSHNPVEVMQFGRTNHPFLAHGSIKRGNELFIGGFWEPGGALNAVRANEDGTLSHVRWSGPDMHWSKGGMMHPWSGAHFWSYGDVGGNAWIGLDGETTAEWDHLAQTGVVGFPNFMGDILIYASDQSSSGVASYDISDPSNPVLLDVLNTPALHPTITERTWSAEDGYTTGPASWGIGGYWSEIYGHYIVFARRRDNPGIQVVDFSDPTNLRVHCEFFVKDEARGIDTSFPKDEGDLMYVGFQDEYVFSERYKLNIETCEHEVMFDEIPNGIDTSQYSRPIGNLLLTGGLANWEAPGINSGMGVWAHQSEPDTRPPFIAHHIPKDGRTNYPLMAPISVMIPETLRSETIVVNDTISITEVGGDAVDIDYILSHQGMLTIDPIEYLKPNTTYEVRLAGIQDALKNPMAEYTFRFSTGDTVDGVVENSAPVISSIDVSPDSTIEEGATVVVTANATDEDNNDLQYRFNFDEGAGYGEWSAAASAQYVYSNVGSYRISVQVRDTEDGLSSATAVVAVVEAGTISNPTNINAFGTSSSLACDVNSELTWAINPDNHTVSQISNTTLEVQNEFSVGKKPKNIAIDNDGNAWVTERHEDRIGIYSPSGEFVRAIELGYGSEPYGIVFDQERSLAYVSLYGAGQVVRIDTNNQTESGRIDLKATASAIAISPDDNSLLVTRFISPKNWGEIWHIDLQSWVLTNTIELAKDVTEDTLASGRGVPNYLAGITIHPNGKTAYVSAKKDNVDRGLIHWQNLDASIDLDDDNSVRAIVATIDLETGEEIYGSRIDLDNSDSPTALTVANNGNYLFVAMQGNNEVLAIDLFTNSNQSPGAIPARFGTELAPQGLCINSDNSQLFSKNLTSRSVSAIGIDQFLENGNVNPTITHVPTVSDEVMSFEVLAGKATFYNADDTRMSAEGYMSCASCHADGGHDGRTFDFSGLGEGLRNTTSLVGRGGTRFGNVHWSANFDEIQDFENAIRGMFAGTGFLNNSDFATTFNPLGTAKAGLDQDLDNLAAYVSSLGKASLPRSPARTATGALTESGEAGAVTFIELGCNSCHRGEAYTDGAVHNVGTLRQYSGLRLGGTLEAIKTPSLLGSFASAPYLHDGSAATLDDVFTTVGGNVYQAEASSSAVVSSGYLRRGAGSLLDSNQNTVTFDSVDGGDGGTGFIRLNYAGNISADGGQLNITVNGSVYSINVSRLLPLPDGALGNTVETQALSVQLDAGGNNTVSVTYAGLSDDQVIIDDMTVSSATDISLASAHTVVSGLSAAQRSELVAFVAQIDQQSAPADDAEIVIGLIEPVNIEIELSAKPVVLKSGVELSWSNVAHDQVSKFQIFRDGENIGNVSAQTQGYLIQWQALRTNFTFQVLAISADDEVIGESNAVITMAGDSVAPTTPGNLTSTYNGRGGFVLNWLASTDDSIDVIYYIYVNNQLFKTTSETSFDHRWPKGDVSYYVVAKDQYGNSSIESSNVEGVIPQGSILLVAESVPLKNSIDLSWSFEFPIELAVSYRIFQDGVFLKQTEDSTYLNQWLGAHTKYSYEIVAYDSSFNELARSNKVSLKAGDYTAPTQPSGLAVESNEAGGYLITWDASTDDTGVRWYRVYINGNLIKYSTDAQYDLRWPPREAFEIKVIAEDNYRNLSRPSEILTVVPE
jgi:sugar lactone lactonase YvrE